MKLHEAFEQIEAKADELDLPPWMDEGLSPIEKWSMASRLEPELSRRLDELVGQGKITATEYRDAWFQILDDYGKHLLRLRLDKILMGASA